MNKNKNTRKCHSHICKFYNKLLPFVNYKSVSMRLPTNASLEKSRTHSFPT